MSLNLPKRISLVVSKAQDLQIVSKSKSKKSSSTKWRVLFQGVEEKLATAKVESEQGSPEWLCEITVTCKNPRDPICLLVTDSKGNHAGQVIISLETVPPKPADCLPGNRPPLLSKNLQKSELEATKKTSNPRGFLFYWLWAEEYWEPNEIARFNTKKSLSKSLHNLSSSALNLFRRKTSTATQNDRRSNLSPSSSSRYHNDGAGNPFSSPNSASTLSPPTNAHTLHNGYHSNGASDASSSTFNSTLYHHHQHQYSNATNNNNTVTSSPSLHNAYTMNTSLSSPNSPVMQSAHNGHSNGTNNSQQVLANKNPFEMLTTAIDISIDQHGGLNGIDKSSSDSSSKRTNLTHQQSYGSKESPSNKKRYGIFNKFRAKKSKSSADLSSMVNQHEVDVITRHIATNSSNQNRVPQSLGKHQGQRLFDKRGEMTPSTAARRSDNPFFWMGGGEGDQDTGSSTLTNGHRAQFSQPNTELNRRYSLNSPFLQQYDESPGFHGDMLKREDMTKSELIGLIDNLEAQLKTTSEKLRASESEKSRLNTENSRNDRELKSVRDELANLKVRLLEAGHTQYLEK